MVQSSYLTWMPVDNDFPFHFFLLPRAILNGQPKGFVGTIETQWLDSG